jgi:hypothetical protein
MVMKIFEQISNPTVFIENTPPHAKPGSRSPGGF